MFNLLNKTEAVCRCGAGSFSELSKHLGKPRQRVFEWLTSRKQRPSGQTALDMLVWTSGKTIAIAAGPRSLQSAYRRSFKDVLKRRAQ